MELKLDKQQTNTLIALIDAGVKALGSQCVIPAAELMQAIEQAAEQDQNDQQEQE